MSYIAKYRIFIERFLKRNAPYFNLLHFIVIIITGVLSLITLIGIIGVWPQLYSLIHKEPFVASISTNCPVSMQHPNLDNYLSAKCAQLTNAETVSLSKENLSQYISVPDGTSIGIRLEKQDIN
jgi:hypothetical protein